MHNARITLFFILSLTIGASEVFGSLQSRPSRQTCSKDKFKCHNGQCIEAFSVCDGLKDCRDGSDETQTVCSDLGIQCPAFAFRCAYGACVDGDSKCDGKMDCADNSDELLPQCRKSQPSPIQSGAACREGKFECLSGECVDEFSVCDGTADCEDGSDETITQCIHIRCPSFSFQCAYGACIDKGKKCNKVEDCNDGSDEDVELCKTKKPKPKPTRPTPPPAAEPPEQGGCVLPNKPEGGSYIVNNCRQGDRSDKCRAVPGTPVEPNVIISFNCSDGYVLEDNYRRNSFCIRGNWDPPPPLCMRMCKPLSSNSLDLTCLYRGEKVSCSEPLLPQTKVQPKCKHSYHIADAASAFKETECLPDGELETRLFTCAPDCGKASFDAAIATISHGQDAPVGEYPWHVGLYLLAENDVYEQACGGTIITPHVVLTAAHCVYIEDSSRTRDPSSVKVAAGKVKRSWNAAESSVQKRDVREIITQRGYQGRSTSYVQDIALLDLATGFVLSRLVLPACIDWAVELVFYRGLLGTVVGWGLNENLEPSEKLQVAHLPYLSNGDCNRESPEEFRSFITYDKFCAGYKNGTGVQQGDSGGGLTFVKNKLYHVFGIVSVKPKDQDTFAAFTNVTEHLDWLEKSINALRRAHKQ